MRKLLFAMALAAFGVTASIAQQATYQGHGLFYSGDESPYMYHNTLMVPVRKTADMVGAKFERDDNLGLHIRFQWNGNRLRYFQGDHFFTLNDQRVEMNVPSQNFRTILFVPARLFHDLTNGDFNPAGRDIVVDEPVHIMFEGRPVVFGPREQPYWRNGILMVPARTMGNFIGARFTWPDGAADFTIQLGPDRIEYEKGRNWYRFNRDRREQKIVSEDRNGVTYVPLDVFKDISHGRVHN